MKPRHRNRSRLVRQDPLDATCRDEAKAALAPRLRRRTVVLMLLVIALLGWWGGWNAERTLYSPARARVEGVMGTRPHLLSSPVVINTPTPQAKP